MTMQSVNAEFAVRLPVRHPDQRVIAESPAKRKVINAGRRGGKTTLAADISVSDYFLNGRKVMYAAPVAKQTDAYWKKCKHYLSDGIRGGYIHKDETRRALTLGTGEIGCQTAHNADTIRSGDADLLIFDEWAYMEYDAWDKVGAPMLLDTNGDAMFISTPNRRNHHYLMFQKGITEGGEWASFVFPSTANPYLSHAAFELLVADMTENAYRQEILAEFLEGEGAVFRNIRSCVYGADGTPPEYQHNLSNKRVMGLDWAQVYDYTVSVVIDANSKQVAPIDRFNQISWQVQRDRIAAQSDKYGVVNILAEGNSIGSPNIEALRAAGLPVEMFATTNESKAQIIQALALAFERGEIAIPNDPVLIAELEAFEAERLTSGKWRYSAPDGLHDDTVIALALAWWAATNIYGPPGSHEYA